MQAEGPAVFEPRRPDGFPCVQMCGGRAMSSSPTTKNEIIGSITSLVIEGVGY
jgi:hypothetical protein